eukprot:m.17967 g.17967  ORF g.17967 m.17967 type:complete len:609 (+) comp6153_c0_seq1:147-1973(+)
MPPQHSYLSSGSGVNLALLRETVRRYLLDCISRVEGRSKALVIEKSLIGVLGLVAEFSALKERGIEKMFPLDAGPLPPSCPPSVIYLVRPDPRRVAFIAEQIKAHEAEASGHDHYIFFTPRQTLVCEAALQEQGVFGNCTIGEFHLNFVPMDSDIMSMELPASFSDYHIHGDSSSIFYTAHALMQIQKIFGVIPRLVGKGEGAMKVKDILLQKRKELGTPITVHPAIESLIIIDRAVDLITPLCSQLTYEGFIDELFGIANNLVELPVSIAELQPNGKPVKVELNSGDKLYAEIRDMNFSGVGILLSHRAKILSREYEERKDAKTVKQIKQFTSKLKRLQDEQASLRMHTDLAEGVMKTANDDDFLSGLRCEQAFLSTVDTDKSSEYIEECICRKEPILKVLRLMCLQSLTNGGLKPKIYDFYRREITQTYGHQWVLTLDQLEKVGLLKLQERNTYPQVKKSMRLVLEDDEKIEADISSKYSGYAPLSVRLVQSLTKPGSMDRSLEETLRLLPGPSFEEKQELPPGFKPRGMDGGDGSGGHKPTTMVLFVGGVTYAEVSAIRFLAKNDGRHYVIGTTSMINGSTLLRSCFRELVQKRDTIRGDGNNRR